MKFPLRKALITAMLICIIFVLEEVMTLIPNVQLTVLLLMVSGAVCGPYYGTIIVLVHVFLDNLFIGSLIPVVMIPMAIGWEIVMLLGFITKKAPLWVTVTCSGLGALAYCWIFVAANATFLDIDMRLYIIQDIPFEIILVVCSVVTVMFLFKPLTNLLNKYWNKGNKTNKKEITEEE